MTAKFLYKNIIIFFGFPIKLVSDRSTRVLNKIVKNLLTQCIDEHQKSTPIAIDIMD